jgi:membrane protease subunit HflK
MAWNDKGGGPWGAPPGGGSGGGAGKEPRRPTPGGNNGPKDFEAMLRRGQERLGKIWPHFDGGQGVLALVAVALGIWLVTGFYTVDPNEQAVIQRLGAWSRTEPPGVHYHLPAPIETATTIDVTSRRQTDVGSRTNREAIDAGTMLTGDSNIVELHFIVAWQVLDPVKFLFNMADPNGVLQQAAESAMREVIGQTDVQPALNEGRGRIETESAAILQATLDRYNSGMQVAAVQLQRVDPPTLVVDSFNDVQNARAELEQQRNQAQAYANDIVPKARGDAQKMIQDAQAYKERTIAEASGEAAQFSSVLAAYQQARDVTARRLYIETMESVLQHARKIIIDPSAEGKTGVIPYLPLPGFKEPAAPPAASKGP